MSKGVALSVWREVMGSVRALPDAAAMGRCAAAIREVVPIPVANPSAVSAFINEQAAAAASPLDTVPVLQLDDEWPVRVLPDIDSAAVRQWVKAHGPQPMGFVRVPCEARYLALVPMPHLDGSWGVFGVMVPEPGNPPWAALTVTLDSFRTQSLTTMWRKVRAGGGLERWEETVLRQPALFNPLLRHEWEKHLLKQDTPPTNRWRALQSTDPVVQRWLDLPGQALHERWSDVRALLMRDAVATVVRQFGDEIDHDQLPEAELDVMGSFLGRMGFTMSVNPDRTVHISAPTSLDDLQSPPTWRQFDTIARGLEQWVPGDKLSGYHRALRHASLLPFLFFDFAGDAVTDGAMTTYDLWRRDRHLDAPFGMQPYATVDLGAQLLLWWAPNGLPLSGMRLALARNHVTNEPTVVAHQGMSDWYPYVWQQPRLESMARTLATDKLGARVWIDSRPNVSNWIELAYPFHRIDEPLRLACPSRDEIQWHPHPHELLKAEWRGAYQPMRTMPAGPVILHPAAQAALSGSLGGDLARHLRREIEPAPEELEAEEKGRMELMFTGSAGRAVVQSLGPEGCVVEGVRYRHLKRIGVGQTHLVRMESPNPERDGHTDQRRAFNRWYCAWALQTMARECDLAIRIPYVAGIWNRGIPRGAVTDGERSVSADLETTVFELCREIICLDDLYAPTDEVQALIAAAKAAVMADLGHATMSDAGYLEWLARTMGEQFAMLSRLHFDHGQVGPEGAAQLHPNNFTLGGEVKDLESGRFVRSPDLAALRYRNGNGRLLPDHVTLDALANLEQDPTSWLGQLLEVVPGVHFARLANAAFEEQWNVLARLGQQPIALRHAFNHKVWSPFMKTHSDAFQFRL